MTRKSEMNYTDKQKRHEKHIENQFEKKGVTERDAKKIAHTTIREEAIRDDVENRTGK